LYDSYDIRDGETPEIIAEKLYGSSQYHWVIMLCNQRYNYLDDFPIASYELEQHIRDKYGPMIELKVNQFSINTNVVHVESTAKVYIGQQIIFTQVGETYPTVCYVKSIDSSTQFTVDRQTATLPSGTVPVSELSILTRGETFTITSLGDFETNFTLLGATSNTINLKFIHNGSTAGGNGTVTIDDQAPVIRKLKPQSIFIDPVYGVHHYVDTNGNTVDQYNVNGTSVSNFDYEVSLNESKRRIKLISPKMLMTIINNFKSLI
jgi:hypothetical protein